MLKESENAPGADRPDTAGFTPNMRPSENGRGQHGHYSHQLSQEATDTLSRTLTRTVPLVYGALLGGLSDNLVAGLGVGLLVSLAFDLSMGEHSLLRSLGRPFLRQAQR